jgi:Tol biopolymer transport system component
VRTRVAQSVLLAAALALVGRAAAAEQQVPPMLVFARGGDLYRMAIDGSDTARLTDTKAAEADPAVSADGLQLAFTRGTKAKADELWISDSRGAAQRRIVAARPARVRFASTSDPAWSPDGRSIFLARAALSRDESCGWIYRVGADGRGLRRVTRGIELDSDPAPSPDGTRVAFSTGECEPTTICCVIVVVNLGGKRTADLRRLPQTDGAWLAPAWSPDGTQIAFELTDVNLGTSGVYVANRDGSHLVRVTPRGLNAEDPAWSPDREWIAFTAWRKSFGSDLYVVHPDGSGLLRVTTTKADESSPSWIRRS